MKQKIMRAVAVFLAVLTLVSLAAGCSKKDAAGGMAQTDHRDTAGNEETTEAAVPEYTALSQLSGKVVTAQAGSIADLLVMSVIDDVSFLYFNGIADQLAALRNKKAEAVPFDEPVARLAAAQNPEFAILPEKIVEDHYGIALQKGSELTPLVNEAIAKLRDDGTLERMKAKWTGSDESVKVLPELDYPGRNGTLRVAHTTATEPMEYVGPEGTATGFDIEMMMYIGQILDRKVEFISVDFSGLLSMLQSGKADAAVGSLSITDERKKQVDMSDPYYDGGLYFVVRTVGDSAASGTRKADLWGRLRDSFGRTFIEENRWRLILNGLWITVLISVSSGVIGLILGFGICMLRRSKKRAAYIPAAGFTRLIQGTPILVLLMILYYIIFGKVDIPAVLVAILGFSVNFGAYSSEMMRMGIDAVDKGQIEAAFTLGFSKTRTFWKITFPQAARHFLPIIKGEFITVVKTTSVVGYIAIQDLTKVSDIIRSRTMEAFFPLLATAVIYFLLSYLLTILFSLAQIRLEPWHRKRIVKGVVMK
jgi:polar amino acid transport system substrate-binding protein